MEMAEFMEPPELAQRSRCVLRAVVDLALCCRGENRHHEILLRLARQLSHEIRSEANDVDEAYNKFAQTFRVVQVMPDLTCKC